jgi:hypothetical protein
MHMSQKYLSCSTPSNNNEQRWLVEGKKKDFIKLKLEANSSLELPLNLVYFFHCSLKSHALYVQRGGSGAVFFLHSG